MVVVALVVVKASLVVMVVAVVMEGVMGGVNKTISLSKQASVKIII